MTDLTFSISKAAALTGLPRRSITEILATLPDDPGIEQLIAAFVAAVRAERAPGNAPRAESRDPNEPNMPRGIHSISALSEQFLLDRATVVKRLRKEQIKPAYEKQKFKGFRLTDKGKSKLTVKQVLEAPDDPHLTDAKIRKAIADARNAELKYEIESKSAQSEILREVRDELTKIFKSLHTRIVKRYWRESAKRLRRCKSVADLQRTGETDQALILEGLKRDYPGMFV
jgi:hypothetical protein